MEGGELTSVRIPKQYLGQEYPSERFETTPSVAKILMTICQLDLIVHHLQVRDNQSPKALKDSGSKVISANRCLLHFIQCTCRVRAWHKAMSTVSCGLKDSRTI